jgi:hypothetical protein
MNSMDENIQLADGSPVTPDHRELKENGQQKGYVVLTEEERAKGFLRPVRSSYIHVGVRPKYPLRDLTPEEHERYDKFFYVQYEEYPVGSSMLGRYWTEAQLKSGCGGATTMGRAIAETYARDPKFYSGTFCCHCGVHFPVGESGEFEWEDGSKVGT